ncbi:hypothetical protein D9M70_591270 [compost metagenome]
MVDVANNKGRVTVLVSYCMGEFGTVAADAVMKVSTDIARVKKQLHICYCSIIGYGISHVIMVSI